MDCYYSIMLFKITEIRKICPNLHNLRNDLDNIEMVPVIHVTQILDFYLELAGPLWSNDTKTFTIIFNI